MEQHNNNSWKCNIWQLFHSLNSKCNYKIEHAIVWFCRFSFRISADVKMQRKQYRNSHPFVTFLSLSRSMWHKRSSFQLCISLCVISVFLGFSFSTDFKTISCQSYRLLLRLLTAHVSQNSSFPISSLYAVAILLHVLCRFSRPSHLPLSSLYSRPIWQGNSLIYFLGWSPNFQGITITGIFLKVVDSFTDSWSLEP